MRLGDGIVGLQDLVYPSITSLDLTPLRRQGLLAVHDTMTTDIWLPEMCRQSQSSMRRETIQELARRSKHMSSRLERQGTQRDSDSDLEP